MLPGPAWAILTDPVCGRSVELTSPHRAVHGGALFAFCSVGCHASFMELPSRYAVIMPSPPVRLLEPSTPAVPSAPPRPRPPSAGRASAPMPLSPLSAAAQQPPEAGHAGAPMSSSPAATRLVGAEPAGERQAPVAPAGRVPPAASPVDATADSPPVSPTWAPLPEGMDLQGERGPFTWLLARRERRYARNCAREMLKLHREFNTRYPELKGHSLYRRVVARRLDGNDLVAEAVLHHATQSFAIWPVERELNFRDVVHYLAVSQYVAMHPGARWVHADIKRVVDELIPAQL